MKRRFGALAAILALGFTASAKAEDLGPWTMGFSLGIPEAVGQTKSTLEDGFDFNVNFGYRRPDKRLGVRFDLIYATFDLSDAALRHIDSSDSGYASVWGMGASVLLTPKRVMRFKPYVYAGPGYYFVTAEVTRVGTGSGTICDPWWGCYPSTAPGQYGVSRKSTGRFGLQGGAGLGWHFDHGGAIVLDFQYVHVNMTHADTEFVPVNLGYQLRI